MGWTSCVGAATAKPRLDVVIRNAINAGEIPGPRYLAASQEITVPGGLGDNTQPHLPQPEFDFGAVVSGPEEMRRCVRMFVKYGVDQIKINLSGESITGMPAEYTPFHRRRDRDVRDRGQALRQARRRARALVRVDQAMRQARHRGDLPRELRRRRSARPARSQQAQALRRAGPGVADQHLASRVRMGPDARSDEEDGLPPRARGRGRDAEDDAEARHPHPARRRLRLRVDAARHQRQGPRVLRQVRRHEHDGSDAVGHRLGRADDEARRRCRRGQIGNVRDGAWPTCC